MRKGMLIAALLTLGLATGAAAQRPTPRAQPRVQAPERVAVARGWLGIAFRGSEDDAAVVGEVMPNSPAARAGLQVGDTVTLWNGRRDAAVAMRERALEPGDTVRIRVRRGGQRDRDLTIVAARRPEAAVFSGRDDGGDDVVVIRPRALERPLLIFSDSMMVHIDSVFQHLQLRMRDSLGVHFRDFERNQLPRIQEQLRELERNMAASGDRFVFEVGTRSVAGAEFTEMNDGLSSYFGTEEGVVVLKVAEETPAARAGLQAGDVVVRVNDQPVTEIAELRRAVARAQAREPRTVTLQVIRRGQRRDLQMRWE